MSPSPDTHNSAVLDGATLVPIGTLAVLISILVGGAVWVTRIEARLQGIEESLAVFIDTQHIEEWVAVFRAQNPTISVPDLRRPR